MEQKLDKRLDEILDDIPGDWHLYFEAKKDAKQALNQLIAEQVQGALEKPKPQEEVGGKQADKPIVHEYPPTQAILKLWTFEASYEIPTPFIKTVQIPTIGFGWLIFERTDEIVYRDDKPHQLFVYKERKAKKRSRKQTKGTDLAATDQKQSTNPANPPTPSQGHKK